MPTDVIHTVGPGGTYADLQEALDDVARDVVALDEVPRLRCFGGANLGDPTGPVFINQAGWNTDPTHPIVIEAAPGHAHESKGELDTSKAHLQANGTFNNAGQINCNQHLVLERMQLDLYATNRFSHNVYGIGGGSIKIRRCQLLYELDPSETQAIEGPNVEWRNAAADGEILASLLHVRYTANSQGSFQVFYRGASVVTTLKVRNCTIVTEGGTGISGKTCVYVLNNHIVDIENCYLARPTGSVYPVALSGSGGSVVLGANVASNETSVPTASLRSIPFDGTTFESVTDGSRDLTPSVSSPLLEVGADTSADGVTEDLIGTPIPNGAAPDIGALERIISTIVQASFGMGGSGSMSVGSTRKRIASLAFQGSSGASIESVRKKIATLGFAGTSGVSVDQIAKLEAALSMGGSGGIDITTGPLKVVANLELGGTSGLSITVGTLRKVIALAFAGDGGLSLAAEALIQDGFVQAASRVIFSMQSMTEGAIYYPGGDLGAGKSIRVVCEREPIAMLDVSEYTQGRSIVIELARDATLGVLEVRENVDWIEVSLVDGKPKERLLVNAILQSDAGVYRILATK